MCRYCGMLCVVCAVQIITQETHARSPGHTAPTSWHDLDHAEHRDLPPPERHRSWDGIWSCLTMHSHCPHMWSRLAPLMSRVHDFNLQKLPSCVYTNQPLRTSSYIHTWHTYLRRPKDEKQRNNDIEHRAEACAFSKKKEKISNQKTSKHNMKTFTRYIYCYEKKSTT